MRYFFARLDENPKLFGNFEKILKFFVENSIGKLNFLFLFIFIFFGNLLLQIELSEITPFFYNNLFRFRGGGISPLSPWLRPCSRVILAIGSFIIKRQDHAHDLVIRIVMFQFNEEKLTLLAELVVMREINQVAKLSFNSLIKA